VSELKRKSSVGRQLVYLFGVGAEELPNSLGRNGQPGSDHLGIGGSWRLGLGGLELSGAFSASSGLASSVGLGFASRTAIGLFGGGRVAGDLSSPRGSARGGSFRYSLLGQPLARCDHRVSLLPINEGGFREDEYGVAPLRAVLGMLAKAQEIVFGGELGYTEVAKADFLREVLEILAEHLMQERPFPSFPGGAQSRPVFTLIKELEHGLVGREVRAPPFNMAEKSPTSC